MFATRARIALSDPLLVVTPLCAHLVEHEAIVEAGLDATRISFEGATAILTPGADDVSVVVEAPDLAALRALRLAIASHIAEFAPGRESPDIRWSGDGAGPSLPPNFRVLAVTAVETLTPHMRRIHFTGADLGRFDTLDALHVRLFIPPSGTAEPVWPMLGEDGLPMALPPEQRPAVRKYTIRAIDADAGTLAIDFVLHDDAGPGSAFAARARSGDRVGMAGPGGRGLHAAARHVFLADETGLPAMGRMLAALPRDAMGLAILEVADAEEEQALEAPAGMLLRWLHRGPGGASRLAEAFEELAWPNDAPGTYLWAATEHAAFLRIRAGARERLRSDRDKHLIVSYWRAGMAEEQHAAEKRSGGARDTAP